MKSDLKYEKENIVLPRDNVLELDAHGYSQHDIAKILNVSIGLVNGDLKHIRQQTKESIKLCIDEEYQKCQSGLNSILKESWTISYKTEVNREKMISSRDR